MPPRATITPPDTNYVNRILNTGVQKINGNTRVTVDLGTQDLYSAVHLIAQIEGKSVTDFVRSATKESVEAWLTRREADNDRLDREAAQAADRRDSDRHVSLDDMRERANKP